ncbi:MAG: hypothetical protein OHK0037_13190 [Elainellaceae cyanobacterium]
MRGALGGFVSGEELGAIAPPVEEPAPPDARFVLPHQGDRHLEKAGEPEAGSAPEKADSIAQATFDRCPQRASVRSNPGHCVS